MEWIRISSNKLKIMLTAEDAARYALCPDTADYADTVTRRAFKAILTDMRHETGFDAADDKVYIQMYPSREGGCELFVTKMGIEVIAKRSDSANTYKSQKSERHPRARRSLAFCFAHVSDLIAVCRRLSTLHYKGESRAWLDDTGRYWLFLTEEGNPLTAREDYAFVMEYGEIESKENAEIMLPEHGKLLCERRAVETLGDL